ncbi:hypothetical protein [Methylotenera versatilis]|uniref:hypothetical protein n=1 Tax=Methylotenera versatilis TaxID=1055487 RepID=UPI0006486BFC|nr:hypothetical protein [Methylotenera versatilis]
MLKITLPAATEKISSSEIPLLIAKAITPPDQASHFTITAIMKRANPIDVPYDEDIDSELFQLEKLNDSDWESLNLASALDDLAPIRIGKTLREDISLTAWEFYEKAFNENISNWKYISFSNSKLNIVANKHLEYLTKAILNNDVTVYDYHTHIPLQNPTKLTAFNKTYMTISDFTSYSKKFNLTVYVVIDDGQGNVANTKNLKKISVSEQQNNAVLAWLKAHNYDPKMLPVPASGKAGVKKECRVELCKNLKLFSSNSVFYTTWDRLRANLQIQDAK